MDDGTDPFGSHEPDQSAYIDFDTPAWRAEMGARYGDRGEFNADINRWIVND